MQAPVKDYYVVQIVKPGRVPESRVLNVVCSKWLFTLGPKKLKYCQLPPEDELNCEETWEDMANRLKLLLPAPKHWTPYRVEILGRDGKKNKFSNSLK